MQNIVYATENINKYILTTYIKQEGDPGECKEMLQKRKEIVKSLDCNGKNVENHVWTSIGLCQGFKIQFNNH